MTLTIADRSFMAQALGLARQGLYSTMPNPRVGCVLVRDAQVVGEGWHVRAGEGHAEVNALAQAGERARGATAYVTLEPCSHTGKTGPCCEALVTAGVTRVVYAMMDPNPRVAGRGIEFLQRAGVVVSGPVMEMEAFALNPGFIKRMEQGLPWVRCKMAMSVDGRTAMADGRSKWITGPRARADVQALRARSCAIVTGIDSVLHDDPSLTLRAEDMLLDDPALACEQQPLRVVLDSRQQLQTESKVVQSRAPLLVVSASEQPDAALAALGVEQCCLPDASGRIDLLALLQELARRQVNEVLVEAGATLAGSFLRAGLVDELVIYMAPKLLGRTARPLFDVVMDSMDAQLPLMITDMRAVGDDWRITATLDPEG